MVPRIITVRTSPSLIRVYLNVSILRIDATVRKKSNFARDYSNENLRETQNTRHLPIVAINIWSYLLWSPVVSNRPLGHRTDDNRARQNGMTLDQT